MSTCKHASRGAVAATVSAFMIVAAIAMLVPPAAQAYLYSATSPIYNQLSIGSVETEIQEEFVEPDDIKPGDRIPKKVSVENVGLSPAWIRVLAVLSPSNCKEWASLDVNLDCWAQSEDGYFYYKKPLYPGERTEPLFTQISISSDVQKDDLFDFDVVVYHESIQAEPFSNFNEAFESVSGGGNGKE